MFSGEFSDIQLVIYRSCVEWRQWSIKCFWQGCRHWWRAILHCAYLCPFTLFAQVRCLHASSVYTIFQSCYNLNRCQTLFDATSGIRWVSLRYIAAAVLMRQLSGPKLVFTCLSMFVIAEIISEKPTEDAITDSEVKITLLVLFGIRHELHICTEILVV